MPIVLEELLPHALSALLAALTLGASAHAVLNKRDVRSAAGWVGLIVLVPGIGAALYAAFGINRIRRRASRIRGALDRRRSATAVEAVAAGALAAELPPDVRHLAEIARVLDRVTRRPLLPGNRFEPLVDGDEAYPAMLGAIERAHTSIALSTYIFDNDAAGKEFARALGEARGRGVEVRVLVDDAGARYSIPPIDYLLGRWGVKVARFMRVWIPWRAPYFNLRNHRKVLVIDGRTGFTGGMNIREGCVLSRNPAHPTRDLHFRVEGPVVTQLMEAFAEDWAFSTRERLDGEGWFPLVGPAGSTLARAIVDGPDEDLDAVRWALLGALGAARRSIRVMTPYFLPDEPLISALNSAALRGIEVDVVLPAQANLRFVQWAMEGELWKILDHGVRVWRTPPPFDHTKLLVVDSHWTLLGSANWDPRSLRLNFELDVETYDAPLAARMDALLTHRIASATPLAPGDLSRSLSVRLRNGAARLLSPYL